ncbi:MAG: MaoC/PaaZ C-terminal domain-containing protein [Rhizomicrobium sp.]
MARSGINYLMVVHGEQRLTMHRALPYAADVTFDERITGVYDKGKDKGAVILMERVVSEKGGAKLCTLVNTIFCTRRWRFRRTERSAPRAAFRFPRARPTSCTNATRAQDQAFLYALSGDRNPLHRDPAIAKMAGFPRPDPARALHLWHGVPRRRFDRVQIRREPRLPASTCAFPRRCFPARPSSPKCGWTETSSLSAAS